MKLPSDRAAAALAALYRDAEARLTATISQALASGATGTAAYRRRALFAVQAILTKLQGEAVPQARQVVRDAYGTGMQVANLTPDTTGAFGGHIHTEAVQVLSDSLTASLEGAVTNVGRQVNDIFRREQLRAASAMLLEQGTVRDASKQLVDSLTSQGVKALTDRAGRQWGLSAYAEMAVRTVSRQAVSEGTKNALLTRGLDLITISSHASSCPVCKPFEDKTYSLTGKTPGYPVAELLPPFHPNCAHVCYPADITSLPISEDALAARIARNATKVPVMA